MWRIAVLKHLSVQFNNIQPHTNTSNRNHHFTKINKTHKIRHLKQHNMKHFKNTRRHHHSIRSYPEKRNPWCRLFARLSLSDPLTLSNRLTPHRLSLTCCHSAHSALMNAALGGGDALHTCESQPRNRTQTNQTCSRTPLRVCQFHLSASDLMNVKYSQHKRKMDIQLF